MRSRWEAGLAGSMGRDGRWSRCGGGRDVEVGRDIGAKYHDALIP